MRTKTPYKTVFLRLNPKLVQVMKRAADREQPRVTLNYLIERDLTALYLKKGKV